MNYVKTSEQLADMLTKASFVAPLWKSLLKLHQIGHHQPINNPPQPEPMFFGMLSVACESGKKSHKNMDVPDRRAILARDSARGCSPPFVASCMALKRSGTGSRPSRSRGPSQRPKQKFVEQLRTMARRRNSEPADPKRMQDVEK